MNKMSIEEAANQLGVSKEAIHNRIRRGSLECVIEDGVKYVLLNQNNSTPKRTAVTRRNTNTNNDMYHKLLEEQNQKLQERVEYLETETRSLRDQKEQMLIAEKKKIEEIYIQKDEQLKSILSAISNKFMLNAPQILEEEHDGVEAEIEVVEIEDEQKSIPISLKKYLNDKDISKKKKEKIKEKFKKKAKKDERIIIVGDKLYIDPNKYDYSDFLDKF